MAVPVMYSSPQHEFDGSSSPGLVKTPPTTVLKSFFTASDGSLTPPALCNLFPLLPAKDFFPHAFQDQYKGGKPIAVAQSCAVQAYPGAKSHDVTSANEVAAAFEGGLSNGNWCRPKE
ncbi:hypothetical protein MTO96_048693 [Rhipicephalus appendiculatus]